MLDFSSLPSTSAAVQNILRFDRQRLKSPAFPTLSAETCVLAFGPNEPNRSPESRYSPNLCASPFSTKVFRSRDFKDLTRSLTPASLSLLRSGGSDRVPTGDKAFAVAPGLSKNGNAATEDCEAVPFVT